MRDDVCVKGIPVSRRLFVAGGMLAMAGFTLPARADTVIGTALEIRGSASRKQAEREEALAAGADLRDRDVVATGKDSFASLKLGEDTSLLLGSETEMTLDSFIAGQGGTIELGMGQVVFDRPEGLPKIDLTMRTAFGMIGVRGTKFFAGPSRSAFAVFVEHGLVEVTGGGVKRSVGQGQGVEIEAPGSVPSEPVAWGEERIREAYASVGAQ